MHQKGLPIGRTGRRFQSWSLVAAMASVTGLLAYLLGGANFSAAAAGMIVLLYLFAPTVSPRWAMVLHRGRPLAHAEAPRIYAILERLSRRAGLHRLPQPCLVPGRSMAAFATGTPENGAIGLSLPMLQHLPTTELAAVLAHEISHIRNRDTRIMAFAAATGRLTDLLSLLGQVLVVLSLPRVLAGHAPPSLALLLLLVAAPWINTLLQLALSRTREYEADAGAAELMDDPRPLARALVRIENAEKRRPWLFFWPVRSPASAPHWLRTHPATEKRVRRLLGMAPDKQRQSLFAPGPSPRPLQGLVIFADDCH